MLAIAESLGKAEIPESDTIDKAGRKATQQAVADIVKASKVQPKQL